MRALNAVISDFEDPDDLTGFGSEELDTGDETRKRRVSSFEDDDDDDGLSAAQRDRISCRFASKTSRRVIETIEAAAAAVMTANS